MSIFNILRLIEERKREGKPLSRWVEIPAKGLAIAAVGFSFLILYLWVRSIW